QIIDQRHEMSLPRQPNALTVRGVRGLTPSMGPRGGDRGSRLGGGSGTPWYRRCGAAPPDSSKAKTVLPPCTPPASVLLLLYSGPTAGTFSSRFLFLSQGSASVRPVLRKPRISTRFFPTITPLPRGISYFPAVTMAPTLGPWVPSVGKKLIEPSSSG